MTEHDQSPTGSDPGPSDSGPQDASRKLTKTGHQISHSASDPEPVTRVKSDPAHHFG